MCCLIIFTPPPTPPKSIPFPTSPAVAVDANVLQRQPCSVGNGICEWMVNGICVNNIYFIYSFLWGQLKAYVVYFPAVRDCNFIGKR